MTQWHNMLLKIEKEFETFPDSYLRQPTISKTICPSISSLASKYFEKVKNSPFLIEESNYGQPPKNKIPFSLTTLQLAYYLDIINEMCPISELGEVCDIGPGYAGLYRLLNAADWRGIYTSVDFPIMHKIQLDYLSNTVKDFQRETFNPKSVKDNYLPQVGNSIMIATFSLNEMPLIDREKVIGNLHHDYFFFQYNRSFDGIDNIKWFDKLQEDLSKEYEIKKWKCPIHFSGTIMMGKKSIK